MEKYKEWENEKEIRMLQVNTNKQKNKNEDLVLSTRFVTTL